MGRNGKGGEGKRVKKGREEKGWEDRGREGVWLHHGCWGRGDGRPLFHDNRPDVTVHETLRVSTLVHTLLSLLTTSELKSPQLYVTASIKGSFAYERNSVGLRFVTTH